MREFSELNYFYDIKEVVYTKATSFLCFFFVICYLFFLVFEQNGFPPIPNLTKKDRFPSAPVPFIKNSYFCVQYIDYMKKAIGKLMLAVTGWKLVVHDESFKQEKKSILICVPHTTNWDFYYSLACFWVLGMPFKIFIKDYYTKSWFGFFFKAIGCIGVDRTKSQNLVEYAVQIIEEADEIALINTPEGTRSFSPKWKQGFYHIAKQTNIPIALCYADYKKKQCGIMKLVKVDDKSFEELLDKIAPYYTPDMAKYPENYNPKLY